MKKLEAFHLIGISVRTSNQNSRAAQDIPALWQRFMSEQTIARIPNKVDNTIYCAYTEYEGDHMKPYTTLIGCKVSSLDDIPADMKGISISSANYQHYNPKGNLSEGVVYHQWLQIWEEDLPRIYETDFEVYGEKAQDPTSAEVDIYVGIKPTT